ncbi:hypothetical protein BGZ65_007481, partial [Modicella reniformis]
IENVQSEDKSAVEFFFERNEQEKKYADFPTSSWAPRSVLISEHGLVDIFWSDKNTREILKRVLGLGISATKEQAADLV